MYTTVAQKSAATSFFADIRESHSELFTSVDIWTSYGTWYIRLVPHPYTYNKCMSISTHDWMAELGDIAILISVQFLLPHFFIMILWVFSQNGRVLFNPVKYMFTRSEVNFLPAVKISVKDSGKNYALKYNISIHLTASASVCDYNSNHSSQFHFPIRLKGRSSSDSL